MDGCGRVCHFLATGVGGVVQAHMRDYACAQKRGRNSQPDTSHLPHGTPVLSHKPWPIVRVSFRQCCWSCQSCQPYKSCKKDGSGVVCKGLSTKVRLLRSRLPTECAYATECHQAGAPPGCEGKPAGPFLLRISSGCRVVVWGHQQRSNMLCFGSSRCATGRCAP